ncbi:type III ribulose-bisphosphate carboxylase [Candidatus Pacearchaeota archaeon ex4484_31]|nr:MAG: type III ribulose-bisphosphate carboxylase [Candidatus Pacearchaeota archaeon ex4484_31]
MEYTDYVDLKYRPEKDDLICEFYVKPSKSIEEAAGAVASESSTGTWTEVKAPERVKKISAKVFSIKGNYIKIAYPLQLFEPSNVPQILSSVAGNVFGMKEIKALKLLDVSFPKKIVREFKGPLFGIPGVRKLLKVKERPLVGTIIKPKLGLTAREHAKRAYQAWIGGCDLVKDDENLTNQKFNQFKKRVVETLKLKEKAERETGERKAYLPNITAETEEMLRRARFVKENNGTYVMVDIITAGWSSLQTLREENESLSLVLHAHRAGYAALSRNPRHGISMLVIAKIARLIGLDQLHIGTIVGKMDTPKREVVAIDQEIEESIIVSDKAGHILEQKWFHIKPMFAVCSGGLHPGHVPYLIKRLGKNIVLQFGGGIHGHPLGTESGARAVRQAVNAALEGIPLEEAAKKQKELKLALERWKKIYY